MKNQLNLDKILTNFQEIEKNWEEINLSLDIHRDLFEPNMYNNLISAYDYLNYLVKKDIDIFKSSNYNELYKLNLKVHGINIDNLNDYKYHEKFIKKTIEKFQKGIVELKKDFLDYKEHPYKSSAYIFGTALSQPQLFIEGNHRTSSIFANYILMKTKNKAFILTPKNAKSFLDPAGKIKYSDKSKIFDKYWHLKKYKNEMKIFFIENSIDDFLK